LGEGLGETAAFLERVVPAAAKTADDLEAAMAALRADARGLAVLLRDAPLDLQAARSIHDGLARFGEGFDRLDKLLRAERLDAMREGFEGMETSLTAGAEQVERLSGYTYPAVTFNGLKPEVSQRPFWPEGETIAKGLRKAAAGVTAAGKEMHDVARGLPELRSSLQESRRVVDRTRNVLGAALRQQDKLDPLLKDLPAKAAALTERLPAVGGDLARVLRATRHLHEVADALRQAQRGIVAAGQRLPELRLTLTRSAVLLKAARTQLREVLRNRQQFETAQQQAVVLGESFAAMLPLLTDQLGGELEDQDQALDDLGRGIDEVGDLLPAYAQTVTRLLWTGRLLAWLVAAIIALHGAYLVIGIRLGRRYSP
jgi:hypothetical protein